jgi:menaquinone-dependent protoporphyrinogen IX oxidase
MCILLHFYPLHRKRTNNFLTTHTALLTQKCKALLSVQNLAALLSATRGGEDALFGFIVHRRRRRRHRHRQQHQHPPGREDAVFIFT